MKSSTTSSPSVRPANQESTLHSPSRLLSLLNWLNAVLPPIIWAALIFFLSAQSSLPSFETNGLDFVFKKLAHITVYAILYLLVYRTVRLLNPQRYHSFWVLPIVICLLYAISDELHQMTVLGRTATARDIGYDMLGVSVAFLHKYGYI